MNNQSTRQGSDVSRKCYFYTVYNGRSDRRRYYAYASPPLPSIYTVCCLWNANEDDKNGYANQHQNDWNNASLFNEHPTKIKSWSRISSSLTLRKSGQKDKRQTPQVPELSMHPSPKKIPSAAWRIQQKRSEIKPKTKQERLLILLMMMI
jgi:hypothetical protein